MQTQNGVTARMLIIISFAKNEQPKYIAARLEAYSLVTNSREHYSSGVALGVTVAVGGAALVGLGVPDGVGVPV